MVSLEKGVLKIIPEKDSLFKTIYEIAFVLNMIAIFAGNEVGIIAPITGIICFAAALLIWFGRKRSAVVIPYITVWFLVFLIYCTLSSLWSSYFYADHLSTLLRLFIIFLTSTSVAIYADSEKDVEKLISLFIFSALIIVFLDLFSVSPSQWTDGHLGSHFAGNNSNNTAFLIYCAEIFAFYKMYNKKQYSYAFSVAIFLFFVTFTGSRKCLMAAVLGPVMIIALSSEKKHRFLKLLLIIGVAVGIFFFIMTNDEAYKVIGVRFETMLDFFSGKQANEGSLYIREHLTYLAKKMFYDRPLVGQGFCSFLFVSSKDFGYRATYAHNNYWQILSELGIIGFILYYAFYAYCIVKLAKRAFSQKNRLALVCLIQFIILLIIEIGNVSVTVKYPQMLIALAYTATYADSSDGRKYKYIKNTATEE